MGSMSYSIYMALNKKVVEGLGGITPCETVNRDKFIMTVHVYYSIK